MGPGARRAARRRAGPRRRRQRGRQLGHRRGAGDARRRTARRQLLIYPATDHPTDRPSRHLFDGYLLPDDTREAFFEVYTRGSGADGSEPRISPLRGRLDGLAPAFVVSAGFDVLRDESEAYAHALQDAGTPIALYRQASLPHGFINLTDVSPAAHRATVAVARRWRQFVHDHT